MWFSLPASDRNLLESTTRIHAEVTVSAAPSTVFALITRPELLVRWSADTRRARWLAGAGGLGHRRQRELQGMRVRERFIVWEPGRRCTYAVESATLPLVHGMVEDIQLVEVSPGVTLVSWSVHLRPTAAVRFAEPLLRSSVQRALHRGLTRLQRYCGEPPTAHDPARDGSAPGRGDALPGFPCGWYAVAVASEVEPGSHKTVTAFGEALDVRRSVEGQVRVAPTTRVGPSEPWVTDEVNGLICVWYDADGGAPRWRIEPQPELEDPRWGPMQWAALAPFRTDLWTLREDAVEPEHYPAVHGMRVPNIRADSNGHELRVVNRMTLVTLPGPWSKTALDIDLHGRLCGVGLYFYRSHFALGGGRYVRQLGISAATPIDGRRLMLRYGLCIRRLTVSGLDQRLTSALMTESRKGYEADRPRMEGRAQRGATPGPASDSALGQYSRWYQQFMPTGVPSASGRVLADDTRAVGDAN